MFQCHVLRSCPLWPLRLQHQPGCREAGPPPGQGWGASLVHHEGATSRQDKDEGETTSWLPDLPFRSSPLIKPCSGSGSRQVSPGAGSGARLEPLGGRCCFCSSGSAALQRPSDLASVNPAGTDPGFLTPLLDLVLLSPQVLVILHLHERLGERPFAQTQELPTSPNPKTNLDR